MSFFFKATINFVTVFLVGLNCFLLDKRVIAQQIQDIRELNDPYEQIAKTLWTSQRVAATLFIQRRGIIGTGFLISDTVALTAGHVICDENGQPEADHTLIRIGGRGGVPLIDYTISECSQPEQPGRAPDAADYAILRIAPAAGRQHLRVGSTSESKIVSDPFFTTFGYGRNQNGGHANGNAQARIDPQKLIRTSGLTASKGDSGSPVLDRNGRVVGMLVAGQESGGGSLISVIGIQPLTAIFGKIREEGIDPDEKVSDVAAEARDKIIDLGYEYTRRTYFMQAREGRADVVKLFIDSGLSPNSRNEEGVPILYLAARFGNTRTVEVLLGAGANVSATFGPSNDTALWGALEGVDNPATVCDGEDAFERALVLIRKGAAVDTLGTSGRARSQTPLTWILNKGSGPWYGWCKLKDPELEITVTLLCMGSNPNHANNFGDTPGVLAIRDLESAIGVQSFAGARDQDRERVLTMVKRAIALHAFGAKFPEAVPGFRHASSALVSIINRDEKKLKSDLCGPQWRLGLEEFVAGK